MKRSTPREPTKLPLQVENELQILFCFLGWQKQMLHHAKNRGVLVPLIFFSFALCRYRFCFVFSPSFITNTLFLCLL
jgi:hypothetical protein